MIETIRLIAAREITTKLRDRAFLISTGVMLLIVVGSVVVPLLLNGDDGHPKFRLAVAGSSATTIGETAKTVGAAAITAADVQEKADDQAGEDGLPLVTRAAETGVPAADLTLVNADSADAATALVRSEDADAALVETADGTLEVIGRDEVDSDLSTLITVAAQADETRAVLTEAGVGDDVLTQLQSTRPPGERLLEPGSPNEGVATVLSFAFAGLFYFTAIVFGLTIAQSVVEEKQSRVIEILVAATPVRLLLAGKIVGNAVLALGQVALLLAIGLAAASATGQGAAASLLLSSGGWFLLFFALGFVMLSCAWAAAGSLAARQEDLQSTTMPLQMALIIPFFLAFSFTDPGTGLKVLSYVPFTSPMSMPRRLLIEDASWWEALISLGIIAATGALLIVLAARLYEGSLLRTGTKTSIAAAWKREKQTSA
ncbi:ABC transporter permease [Kineosporia mesophila]|uniref:ABC transporter permease n=1 Tax=Kineosporia mesophila TaxID=566012 RepID=A0ABP6ZJP8_9ACTN|nr:ABC transporter permease [Kineosporia mesophila]